MRWRQLDDIDRVIAIWSDCHNRFSGDSGWLFGRFSVADAMYAPVVLRLRTYGINLPESAGFYPHRVLESEAMQDWLAAAHSLARAEGVSREVFVSEVERLIGAPAAEAGFLVAGTSVGESADLLRALPPGIPLSLEVRSAYYREHYPDPAARARAIREQTERFLSDYLNRA